MKKYIDFDAIYQETFKMDFYTGAECRIALLSQPTADVVEVVRCEKCKYFREYSDAHKRAVERADGDCYLKLTHSYDEQFIACRYNDFCSYGERK